MESTKVYRDENQAFELQSINHQWFKDVDYVDRLIIMCTLANHVTILCMYVLASYIADVYIHSYA